MTLKCFETNGCPWLSWVRGITPYAELQVSRKDLLSNNSSLSIRGGSADMSGSELIGTGPHKLKQKFSQSKLLKNSKKRYSTSSCPVKELLNI
uniref:Uncharacterized protein n=1 Tax=Arundo donax TaxID=35708 RepID=A0A0A9EC76_ARUDO